MLLPNQSLHFYHNPRKRGHGNLPKLSQLANGRAEVWSKQIGSLEQKLLVPIHTPSSVSKPATALPENFQWQHQGRLGAPGNTSNTHKADSCWRMMAGSVYILWLHYLLGGKLLRLIYYWLSDVSSWVELQLLTLVTGLLMHSLLSCFPTSLWVYFLPSPLTEISWGMQAVGETQTGKHSKAELILKGLSKVTCWTHWHVQPCGALSSSFFLLLDFSISTLQVTICLPAACCLPLLPVPPSLTISWLFSMSYWRVSNPISATQPQIWVMASFTLCLINLYLKITFYPHESLNECWVRHAIEMKAFRLCDTWQSRKLRKKVGISWRSWARHEQGHNRSWALQEK